MPLVRSKRDEVCKSPRTVSVWCLVCSRPLVNSSSHLSSPPVGLLAFAPGLCCCQCQARLTNPISSAWSNNKVWVFFAPWFSWCPGWHPRSSVDSLSEIPTALPAALPLTLSDAHISSCSFSGTLPPCDLSWIRYPWLCPWPISGLLRQKPTLLQSLCQSSEQPPRARSVIRL